MLHEHADHQCWLSLLLRRQTQSERERECVCVCACVSIYLYTHIMCICKYRYAHAQTYTRMIGLYTCAHPQRRRVSKRNKQQAKILAICFPLPLLPSSFLSSCIYEPYLCLYLYLHLYQSIPASICIFICNHLYMYVYVCMYTYIYIYTLICMCIYIYVVHKSHTRTSILPLSPTWLRFLVPFAAA